MTTQLGTFIPLQAHPTSWGSQALNQSASCGLTGWNTNAILSQNQAQNPQHTSILVAPAVSYPFGNTAGDLTQAVASGTTVAFIPHTSPVAGSFAPSHTSALQGIPSGTTFVSIPSGWQARNQTLSGLPFGNPVPSQSFAAELSETSNEFVLSFDVPGIDVEDLDVSLSGNTIFINGVRKESNEATTLAYSEIAKGNITRTISVPFDVSPNKAINTSLDNGVLKIRIAKETQSEKRSASRKIKIG